MSDAMQLYQNIIMEHNRAPRGALRLNDPTHESEGFNPICGDRITVTIKERDHTLEKVAVLAESCALCRASASVLVDTLEGQEVERARIICQAFETMLTGGHWEFGGSAVAFAVVREFPARAKCVLLPWKTFRAALDNHKVASNSGRILAVTTESVVKG